MSCPAGPVRGIDFHKQQPLFVSGGDDYKIKVRNPMPDTYPIIIACVYYILIYTAWCVQTL